MGDWLTIEGNDTQIRAYLAVPESGSGPGVLVCHAWWGLNEFFVSLCDRLAGEGFVALAADMYNGRTATTVADAEALLDLLTRDHAQAVATTALDTLLARPEVRGDAAGTLGCSLGGAWALLLSAWKPAQVAAVVDFYGVIEGDFTSARASYLGHFAPGDEYEPDDGVHALEAALREAGHDVTFHWYPGAGHWFFESNRSDAYNPEAATLAWQRTLSFLRSHLT